MTEDKDSAEFAQTGAKIGSTINIRKPNRYYIRRGSAMQTQNTQEVYVPLTLTTQYGTDISFSSVELTLSLDDFSKRILTPAMARISSAIDQDGCAQYGNIYNFVGTANTTPGANSNSTGMATTTAPSIYLNGGSWLDMMATPRDENRRVIINPVAMAQSVAGLSGLFQDSEAIGSQYRKGVLGYALGFEFAMDQNVNTLTVATHAGSANAVVNGANQTGSNLATNGWTAKSAILNANEIIQLAGVYAVNPENQQSTGFLQNFTVLANASSDANGAATLSISPSIIVANQTTGNPATGTVTISPAANAAITLSSGAANGTYPQNLAYHQDAFTFATADLELPQGVDFAARENYDGVSMRIIRAFDITNDQFPCRIDVLGGWATLRPEMAVRILG